MSWNTYKREYEQALNDANVYDIDARRAILKLLRSINTLQNRLDRGESWSSVNNSPKRRETDKQKYEVEDYYFDEWQAFADVMGFARDFEINIGDWLA